MLTLDEQVARLADHAEAAAAATVRGTTDVVRSPCARRWALAVAAAVVAVGMAAVVVAPRWVEPDEPFGTEPATTAPVETSPASPESSVPIPTAPAVQPLPYLGAPRASRFPALPPLDERDARVTVTSGFVGVGSSAPLYVASSNSLVGRLVDDEVVDGVWLRVLEAPISPSENGFYQIDPVTVAGRTYDAWRASAGNPVMTSLVDQEDPRIEVTGADPTAYLDSLGVPPVSAVTTGDDRLDVELAPVPSGWTVIMPPTSAPGLSLLVQLVIPSSGGESIVNVSLYPNLPAVGTSDGLRRVDVNGAAGWLMEDASAVYWALGDGEFAWAMSSTSAEDALDLARSVEFVDEATFRERYDVGPDDMPLP